jgi:hypothetical protein
MVGWKARRYRPVTRRNQRFTGAFGIQVASVAYPSGNY